MLNKSGFWLALALIGFCLAILSQIGYIFAKPYETPALIASTFYCGGVLMVLVGSIGVAFSDNK